MVEIKNVVMQKELVYIETNDYIIRGYITAPVNTKKGRILSDILNSNRHFIALEQCKLEPRRIAPIREIEEIEFLQVNKSSIILMKPIAEF